MAFKRPNEREREKKVHKRKWEGLAHCYSCRGLKAIVIGRQHISYSTALKCVHYVYIYPVSSKKAESEEEKKMELHPRTTQINLISTPCLLGNISLLCYDIVASVS